MGPRRVDLPIKGITQRIEELIKGDPTLFFERMVAKMTKHAHKSDSWKTTSVPALSSLLDQEVKELWEEVVRVCECYTPLDHGFSDALDRLQNEAADVANFALMIYLKAELMKLDQKNG